MTLFLTRRTPDGRCPACGTRHAACGGTSGATGVDERMEVAAVGGPLRKYNVTTGGGHTTVLKLNEADAERQGLSDADLVENGAAPEAAPAKAGAAPNTGRSGSANKARTSSANKGGRKPAARGKAAPAPAGDGPPDGVQGDGPDPAGTAPDPDGTLPQGDGGTGPEDEGGGAGGDD